MGRAGFCLAWGVFLPAVPSRMRFLLHKQAENPPRPRDYSCWVWRQRNPL